MFHDDPRTVGSAFEDLSLGVDEVELRAGPPPYLDDEDAKDWFDTIKSHITPSKEDLAHPDAKSISRHGVVFQRMTPAQKSELASAMWDLFLRLRDSKENADQCPGS
jgi:hypothetical protein